VKRISLILFVTGLILLIISLDLNITGAVIGSSTIQIENNYLFIISLVLLIISAVFFVANKSLESLVIPTGTFEADKKRVEVAMRSYAHSRDKPYLLVSGEIHRNEEGDIERGTQQYSIYRELRDHYGLKPSDFIIEGKSRDTLENFLFSIRKLKKKRINHLKIATNPTQYWRFKLFERQAKREGLLEESFEIEPLYTSESPKEFVYGVLSYVKDYIRVKSAESLEKASNNRNGTIGMFLRKFLSR